MSSELQIHPRHADISLGYVQTPEGPTRFALKEVAIKESVKQAIAKAVEAAKQITQVTDDDELVEASEVLGQLKQITGGLEASRVRFKDPFLKACKLIDAAVKVINGPALAQQERIQLLAGAFDGARRRESEAEKRRLEQQAREIHIAAQSAPTLERKEMLEEVAQQTHLQARSVVTTTLSRTRLGWDYDPHQIDWKLVEANYPQLIEKSIKKMILNDLIRQLENGGVDITETTIPGLRLIPKDKAIGL